MAPIRTNPASLRKWLNLRKAVLERRRQPHERKWQQIREIFCPSLGRPLKGEIDVNDDAGDRDDEKIYNSTPRILLNKLASGLQSGITNQARQWFVFRAKNKANTKIGSVRSYLGKITDHLHAVINASNVYAALDQMYMRLGAFGQSAGLLVPDAETVMRLIVSDEGAYWLAEDKRGRVNTIMRRLRYTYSQMREEFGEDALSQAIRDRIEHGDLETEENVYNLVCPTASVPFSVGLADVPQGREFVSVYWTETSDADKCGILAVRSYDYNPIIAPRWAIHGQTVYGFGPGEMGLADAKALNAIELASLRLTELESNPPMAAPASMKGIPLDTGPGGVTFYDPSPTGGQHIPVQRLFETRQSIEAVEIKIQAITQRLNQIFYTDLFAMLLNLEMKGQPRTATEVNELAQEKVSLLGPVLTRLNHDLLTPLIDAAWHITYSAALDNLNVTGADPSGITDVPQELVPQEEADDNGEVDSIDIEYTSTLHAEQMSTSRLSGPFRFIEYYGGVQNVLRDPTLRDNIDGDKMLRTAAEILDSSGFVRDEKDVETIRKGRAEAQQAQMQAQQNLQAAQAQQAEAQSVKDLAESQLTDGGTALDIIAGAQGVGL